MFGIAYGKGMFVAVGEAGTINICKPGSTSFENLNFSTSHLLSVVYRNNQFVIVGEDAKIITYSPDIGFKTQTSPMTTAFRCIAYKKGGFIEKDFYVAVGDGGNCVTSYDGITWSPNSIPIALTFNSIAYGNGLFVLVGNNGYILTTENGSTYSGRSSGVTTNLYSVEG
jgi:hypothetical protein